MYYASRTLSPSQRNYSATVRECLAVKWACDQFRPYLLGRPFKLFTDHAALRWLFRTKDPKSMLVRWILTLQEFDMTILSRPGKANGNADALSRLPVLLEPHSHHMIAVVTRSETHSLPASRRRDGLDPDLALDARAYDTAEAIRLSLDRGDSVGRGPIVVDKDAKDNVDRTDKEADSRGKAADRTDKETFADRTDDDDTETMDPMDIDSLDADRQHMIEDEEPDLIDDGFIDGPGLRDQVPRTPEQLLASTDIHRILPNAQRADKRWLPIVLFLEDGKTQNTLVTDPVRAESRDYRLYHGVLYRQWDKTKVKPRLSTEQYRVVIPLSLQGEVLRQYHDGVCGAHLGESKTYERIADSMFWPSMYRDILDYVKSCSKCSARKTHYHVGHAPNPFLAYSVGAV